MTAAPQTFGPTVRLEELRVGEMLAEGGEGRVFEMPVQPHLVFKSYRRPVTPDILEGLVSWPSEIDPRLAGRVKASSSWPAAVVVGRHSDLPAYDGAVGLLLPRAPRRFALRHRDGTTRLASLSYLTADPAHRAVAYGLALPGPVSALRIGLVYALARLLEAFESASPSIGHGDLSTKNVLWSISRGPEVFVIDCDNCERFDADGEPLGGSARRRAMTPNWDDPAVPVGTNPTPESDRYSLALIFLRVVGAANFPVQARQRQGEKVEVDFAVPPGVYSEPLLGPGAPLWDMCARGLSVTCPRGRPAAGAWVAALEAVLDAVGAADLSRAVWEAQGGGEPSALPFDLGAPEGDVVIRPVPAAPRPAPRWTLVAGDTPATLPWHRHQPAATASFVQPAAAGSASPAILPQLKALVGSALRSWVELHRRAMSAVARGATRLDGLRALAMCVVLDVLVGVVVLFAGAMVVAPVLGI